MIDTKEQFSNEQDLGGRPSKFQDNFVEQAEKLARMGATDIEIADVFDVDVRTLYRWKAENTEFCQALKTGKSEADERVERSLYARAVGYEHDEMDIKVVDKEIVLTPVRKHYPPDTGAAKLWLTNRRSQDWRDKVQSEHTGPDGGPIQVEAFRLVPLTSGS